MISFRASLGLARVALLCSLAGTACARQDDVIAHVGSAEPLSEHAIDVDPLALLPGNPMGALTLDAKQLFSSEFGQRLLVLTRARSPLPAQAGFEPSRDLERVYVGIYSTEGAVVAGVAIGRFELEAIAQAAREDPKTAAGRPLSVSRYAGRPLYLSGGLGFTPLTPRTLLFGNEPGIRRALDRLEGGRVQRRLPIWLLTLLEEPGAPIVAGAALEAQPLSAALRDQVTFVDGLRTLSLVGNFEPPGLNLAGTLVYETAAASQRGAENLQKLHSTLSSAGLLMALVGIPQPLRKLDAVAREKETRFALGIDGAAVLPLLEKALPR